MDLLFAANDGFVRHLGVAMLSVLRTQSRERALRVHVLHHDISAQSEARLGELKAEREFELTFHRVDPGEFAAYPAMINYLSIETYFRLKAHRLFADLDRILYLDADTICRADLGDLWATDLGGNLLGGVVDQASDGPESLKLNGLMRPETPYFNAGVLLLNLAEMRARSIEERFAEVARQHGRLMPYADQDLLNVACEGAVTFLPLRYNVQSNFFYKADSLDNLARHFPDIEPEFRAALADPAILHFTGREKPWHITSRHPMTEAYRAVERTSPWRDAPLLVDHLRYRPHPLKVMLEKLGRRVGGLFGAGGEG